MKSLSVRISPPALLAAALLYFFADGRLLAATALAAAVHELGHIIALLAFGLRIRTLRFELTGLCIDYSGCCTASRQAIAAVAGPTAGLALALLPMRIDSSASNEFVCLVSSLSFLLSLFNLVPLPDSDGARILRCICGVRGERFALAVEQGCAVLFFAFALLSAVYGQGFALLLTSTAVLLSSIARKAQML